MHPTTLLTLSILFASGSQQIAAQTKAPEAVKPDGKPIAIGTSHKLHSKILDETRRVLIYTPRSLTAGKKRYPMLYLLDGPAHFHHTSGSVEFLASNGRMPETIVVAIANTNRSRDLTPSASNEMGELMGGGAEKFLSFLCDELSPWVEARYPTRPARMLIGHSFGGLFAVHAMIRRPDFFQGIIAISPSMQWDKQRLVGEVDQWMQKQTAASKTSIYITAGNEGVGLLGGSMKVAGIMSQHAPTGMRWKFTHMPNESHGSVPHRSTYDGLEWLFDGWTLRDPLATFDRGGLAAIEAHHKNVRKRYGYSGLVPIDQLKSLLWSLVQTKRIDELHQLLTELDPKRYPVTANMFLILASQGANADLEAGTNILRLGLEVWPADEGLRRAGKQARLPLPPLPKSTKGK